MTLFKTSNFTIITCNCYSYQWNKIKRNKDESWKFDDIENGKDSIRKLFHQKMSIFHCCKSCFEKSVMTNPFTVTSTTPVGYCLMFNVKGKVSLDDICNSCIWFFIENFKKEFKFY